MYVFKVNSEWDLGIPELFESEDLAREYVEAALPEVDLEDGLEYYEDECLISFEAVKVCGVYEPD